MDLTDFDVPSFAEVHANLLAELRDSDNPVPGSTLFHFHCPNCDQKTTATAGEIRTIGALVLCLDCLKARRDHERGAGKRVAVLIENIHDVPIRRYVVEAVYRAMLVELLGSEPVAGLDDAINEFNDRTASRVVTLIAPDTETAELYRTLFPHEPIRVTDGTTLEGLRVVGGRTPFRFGNVQEFGRKDRPRQIVGDGDFRVMETIRGEPLDN